MGDDNSVYIWSGQPMRTTLRERLPSRMAHVFAVQLRKLFTHQLTALQAVLERGYRVQKVLDAQLTGGVAGMVTGAGRCACDGAACSQNHNFLTFFCVHHLHCLKNWLKIQSLDEKTAQPVLTRRPP